MSLATDVWEQEGGELLMEQHGEIVTYTPVGGAGSPVTVRIIRRSSVPGENDEEGHQLVRDATVWLRTAEVAAPAEGDKITFDGADWKVGEVNIEAGRGEARLECVLLAGQEFSEPGTRRTVK
ncbi:MAG: hypothetical protein ACE5EX_00140 [Phycisphaerae bacterium]